jgi:neutral ceramidase
MMDSGFLIGCGISDITGPAAELGMLGYASPFQQTGGIHMRLHARAFVIESRTSGNRLCFVSADLCMVGGGVKQAVIDSLATKLPGRYTHENLIVSATHTHSGPGAFIHHALYSFSTFGFDRQNFEVIVKGIVESIAQADGNLRPGTVKIAAGELPGLTKNRSPKAYALNPASERARYSSDTDDSMTLLRLEGEDGSELGVINWFAIHGTSLDNGNRLISGDNSGYASHLFEQKIKSREAGHPFVAAFAQSNEGDISPNIYGGRGGRGADQFESLKETATREFNAALELFHSATETLDSSVDYRHSFIDMADVTVAPEWTGMGAPALTCTAAIGISMLAGTEDGRGVGWEGISWTFLRRIWGRVAGQAALFWLRRPWRMNVLRDWYRLVRAEKAAPCQGEKVRVIPTGTFNPPWSPHVLPFQVCRIGSLGIVAVPFECTSMSGRRIKETILDQLRPAGVTRVVIAGLANAYAGYVATREEYDRQDYEGASTHFGPWTLAAIQQETAVLARALATDTPIAAPLKPAPQPSPLVNLQPGVFLDVAVPGRGFGDVMKDAEQTYRRGDTVAVTFWSGHPRNSVGAESTFLEVQHFDGSEWKPVANDDSPDTRFHWRRWPFFLFPFSTAKVSWTVPRDIEPGSYRIQVFGAHKRLLRGSRRYKGTSREFLIG